VPLGELTEIPLNLNGKPDRARLPSRVGPVGAAAFGMPNVVELA
jgi:hypothetical protein